MDVNKIGIFYSKEIKKGGGPSGYLYNLREALRGGTHQIEFIFPKEQNYAFLLLIGRVFASILPVRKIRHKVREYLYGRHIANCINACSGIVAIMFHSCSDINLVKKLWDKGYIKRNKPKFVLMSHSPVLPSFELQEQADYCKSSVDIVELKNADITALKLADLVIAPSKNAMNAYREEFPELMSQKDIRYIVTGCPPLDRFDKDEVRKKYNIKTKFVICYVGRHWKVKGYDRLLYIAQKILQMRNDVTFLIAGKQNPAIKPLFHSRWIELGWADPAEVFCCSDIFLMPSRESYFDLVIPEALSTGLKCIISNVGGNIDFSRMCSHIDLFSNDKEAIERVNQYLALPERERCNISKEIIVCYQKMFNLQSFAKSYIEFSASV